MKSSKVQNGIRQITNQIVKLVHPVRILLFGSAVTGRMNPDSDLDFLVVVPEAEQAEAATDLLNTRIRNKPMPCDFLVVTPSVLKKNRNNPGTVYREILASGKEIYAV
jgi:predicted nucleotidyltransferase